MKNSNYLVIDGGVVKTSEEGVVSGMGIVFGSEAQPDQSSMRDFFTEDSFITKRKTFSVPLYYDHGLGLIDEEIGEATLTKTKDGWFAEANIDTTSETGKKIHDRVKDKPHGFSTGAVSHLVKREARGNNTNFLKKWPVGELSLTERPAERRATVQTVKSIDGAPVYEDAFKDTSVIVALYDEAGTKIWDVESGTEPPKEAKTIELKYAGGSISYELFVGDETSTMEISVEEYGDPQKIVNQIQAMLNKAAENATKSEDEFKEQVRAIVLEEIAKSAQVEEVTEEVKSDTEEIADDTSDNELAEVKSQLEQREIELAAAKERMEFLEVLAGLQETINDNKGK